MSVVMECESRIQHETLNDCRDEEDVEDHGVQTVLIDQNGSSSPSPSPSISSQDGTMGSEHQQHHHAVKQWSYEEQFRQLYNLSEEPERKDFLDRLFDFMAKKGTPITRIPIMAKQPLDMYKLFKLVVERGGLVEVIKKKAWRDIAKELNLPASITSAAFTMRSQYVKYLYSYECEVECLSDPKELQMAIESNKRDRRHSDTMEFIQTCREERREQILTQPTYTVTGTPSGLQLISSPTVALPQANMPPYSSGFIITPSGAHVVHTPRLTPGAPQLLQMAATHPHLPIVVPTSLPAGTSPLAAATMIPIKQHEVCTSPLRPNERKIDEDPPQMPVLIHTGPAVVKNDIIGGKIDRRETLLSRERDHEDIDHPPPAKRAAVDIGSDSSISSSGGQASSARMPFTNISVKPGGVNVEGSPSILVTIELNGFIYQGVLFARPGTNVSSSPTR